MDTDKLEFWSNMAHGFLRVVQPRRIDSLVEYLGLNLSIPNDIPSRLTEDGGKALLHYTVGYIVCASIGVSLLLLVPLIGCIMCCCRTCCGKCGANPSPPNDTDRCKRYTYSIIILVLSSVNILAVCMAFITVTSVQKQTKDGGFMKDMAGGFIQLDAYKNFTLNDLQFSLYSRVSATNQNISENLDAAPWTITDEIASQTQVTEPLGSLVAFVSGMNDLENNLIQMQTTKSNLTTLQNNLANALNSTRNSLKIELDKPTCNTTACRYLKETNHLLREDFNFTDTGDILPAISALRFANTSRLDQMVNSSIQEFTNIAKTIHNSTSANLNNIKNQTNQFERTVKERFESSTRPIRNLNIGELGNTLSHIAPRAGQIANYVFILFILFSCVLLITLLLNISGAAVAFKCKSSDSNDACSLRRLVSDVLLAGASLTFIFTFFWTTVTIVTFIVGGLAHNEVCRYMRGSPDIGFGVLTFDRILGSQLRHTTNLNFSISVLDVSENCKRNLPLYIALDFEKHGFDIRKLLDLRQYGLDKKLDELRNVTIDIGRVTILPVNLRTTLVNLDSAFNELNINSYHEQLNRRLLKTDLNKFVKYLNESASVNPVFETHINNILILNSTTLESIRKDRAILRFATNNVSTILQKSPVDLILQSLNYSQITLNTYGNEMVQLVLNNTVLSIWNVLNTATRYISTDVRQNVGRCRPAFEALNQIIEAPCYHLLHPVNGIWFAYGWCLFLFIPMLIFTIKLSGLLRKDPEEKPSFPDDTEYMMPLRRFQNSVAPETPKTNNYMTSAVGLPPVTSNGDGFGLPDVDLRRARATTGKSDYQNFQVK